jgi:hypothetical protein
VRVGRKIYIICDGTLRAKTGNLALLYKRTWHLKTRKFFFQTHKIITIHNMDVDVSTKLVWLQ